MPRSRFRIARSNTGLGMFASVPFKKGEYIVTYQGRRIRNAEADRLEARGACYMFELNSRWTIDGSGRHNKARYVNHACKPNAEALDRKGGIVYVARRRIKPGEEITVHYGKEYYECFLEDKGCRCATCRAEAAAKRARKRKRAKAKARRRRG